MRVKHTAVGQMANERQWNFRLKNAGNGFIVFENDGEDSFSICDVFMTNEASIAKHRAQLIAAAPELLAACKAAIKFLKDMDCDGGPLAETLRFAIQKAEAQS